MCAVKKRRTRTEDDKNAKDAPNFINGRFFFTEMDTTGVASWRLMVCEEYAEVTLKALDDDEDENDDAADDEGAEGGPESSRPKRNKWKKHI